MIQIVDLICKYLAGGSLVLIALSFMYVCAAMVFVRDLIAPPVTLFIGLFGIFAAMLLYGGAHLIAGDLL